MEEDILKSIDKKLDVIIKIYTSNLIKGKNQKESIIMLADMGIEANTIANIVKTAPSTVSARLVCTPMIRQVGLGESGGVGRYSVE